MSSWTRHTLGDLVINHDAKRIPVRESDRKAGPYPYYGASGIVDHVDRYIFEGLHLLIAEDGENLRTRQTPIAFLADDRFWVNNHAHIVVGKPDVADTRFLCYALAATDIAGYLTGSAMPKLSQKAMNAIELAIPSISEQLAIATVLGSLDDKIEQNRRTGRALEGLARAVFKAWFVDFEPVKAKAAGATAFPGMPAAAFAALPDRLVDSELGPVPEGWEVASIKERASLVQYGLTTSATTDPVGPHFLRITDIRGGAVDWATVPFCTASAADAEKYRILDGDIVVARTGASTGENLYVVEPPEAVFASYLVRFQFADRGIARIVGEFMRTDTYQSFVKGTIGGSAQPNANAQMLAAAKLTFPSVEISAAFYGLVHSLDVKRAADARESRKLAALRDYLLPRLLSGKVRVGKSG